MANNLDVVQNENGGWDVKLENHPEPKSHHKTQAEAMDAAKVLATELKSEVITHGVDGKIRQKDSFGNDPEGIKG